MNLSQHFTLDELVHSQIAARLGIDNEPSDEVVGNLRTLCLDVLEPLRNAIGRPIFVSSGYRSAELNAAVNGSPGSDHLVGLAADIVAPPMTVEDLARAVRRLSPYVPLNQCIMELGRWVHVSRVSVASLDTARRPDFLVASLNDRGSTVYSKWES